MFFYLQLHIAQQIAFIRYGVLLTAHVYMGQIPIFQPVLGPMGHPQGALQLVCDWLFEIKIGFIASPIPCCTLQMIQRSADLLIEWVSCL